MRCNPFLLLVVLSCAALSAACTGDSLPVEPLENPTEVNLLITDPDAPDEEVLALIDFVSYRVTCPASGLTPYDDSVDISGNFEVDETADPPVWELFADLPPAICTIALWVFFEDEVICSGTQAMNVVEGGDPSTTNKFNILLECTLSVNPPSGDADIDGTFNLIHGNYCPQLFWLGAYPSAVGPTVFNVETLYDDPDDGCGLNCDPQTCDFAANPPVCSPAPDPGLSSTLSAPAGNGSFGDENATMTTYACDPLLPGPTEICVLVTDGDIDCDRLRCTIIDCPDLCENVDCTDGSECTWDRCDPFTGSCSNDPAPDGVACNNCDSTCVAGACTGPPFTAAINGDAMSFVGNVQQVTTTYVNPYSGASTSVNGNFNVNISSYKGIGANDTLTGTNLGDVLLVQDPVGTQRICGVEQVLSQNSFDIMFLADSYIVLDDMLITGGNASDVLWANAGNDTLQGNNGVDLLDGGPGNDIIEGGNGNDTITLWPGSGFDSIDGGIGVTDRVEIDAIQSQITIVGPSVNPSYQFDIFYLGTPMAEIREVELVVLNDTFIDLLTCTGSAGDVCNLCGNDALNGGEGCDDGNNVDGDGCAADCTAEY
jgi:cysteine-rich repeat protein